MSNIFIFLLLCSVGLSVASLITPKAFFVALPQRRTRLKGFLFWCLTGNAFFLAFSLAMDAEAGKNVHGPILIACILLLGCLLAWGYLLRRRVARKAPPPAHSETTRSLTEKEQPAPQPPHGIKHALPKEFFCQDNENNIHEQIAKVEAKIKNEQFLAALQQMDTLFPIPKDEEEIFIQNVDECFYGLANKKHAVAALALYDNLREKSAAFAAVTQHGPTGEMVNTLDECLKNPLPQKDKPLGALKVASLEHPLTARLYAMYPASMLDFLDSTAEEIFDDWESCGLPDAMPDDEILQKLCDLLKKDITPKKLRAEFDAFAQSSARTKTA